VAAVFEQEVPERENRNQIVSVNVESSQSVPSVLVSGCEFYAAPVISQEGDRIAWIEWNHPNMPWDTTRLCQGGLSHNGQGYICDKIESIINQEGASVCQPGYLHDGSLVYAYDSSNSDWWNLYRYDDGSVTRLTDESAEFGEAHWVFGQTRWVQTGLDVLVAIATDHCGDRLLSIDLNGKSGPILKLSEPGICHLHHCKNKLLCVAMPEDRPGSIVELELSKELLVNVGPQSSPLLKNGYAAPEPVECPTTDGESTWGYFYPPFNPGFVAPDDCLPPLVVMVHGGPTSRTNRSFHPLRQYFTTLGFAVFDINHRGSTGYGHDYRQRLLGEWGEVDCMDIADSIRYLVNQGRIDPDAIFIRGGSAGGYAVLRALTRFPELFAGGACYYGIGNLITLSEITHKFEARYTDRLVGEVYAPESARMPASRYVTRSPIFAIEQIDSPLILFQGLLDKIVPPEVSREVVSLLEKNGVPHAYTEYDQEGHGFRGLETRIDSLEKETTFFKEIIDNSHSS
jgi:dipeptidyl aminopeptidase/acylaminoacyl peptidase